MAVVEWGMWRVGLGREWDGEWCLKRVLDLRYDGGARVYD
jgi:hypothetical protein